MGDLFFKFIDIFLKERERARPGEGQRERERERERERLPSRPCTISTDVGLKLTNREIMT